MTEHASAAPATMPILEHIRELRKRLIVSALAFGICFVVAFVFYQHIVAVLTVHFERVNSALDANLFMNTITEGFMTRVKVALAAGVLFSLPVHVFNALRFVFPGLLGKERAVLIVFVAVSFVLVVAGGYWAYFQIIPITVTFLTTKAFVPENVGILLTYRENVFYIFQFILWSVVAFQLPLLLELLMMMNVLKRKMVWRFSRYIVVGIFVLSAIITPPDVVSQIAIALPLLVLYFLALVFAKLFNFGGE